MALPAMFMGKAFSYHSIIESIQSFLFKQTSKCRAGASWSKENKSPTEANIGKHSFNGCKKKHVGVQQIGYCLHCTIKKSKQ